MDVLVLQPHMVSWLQSLRVPSLFVKLLLHIPLCLLVKIVDGRLYFIFPFHFYFTFLFLEQLGLGFISHAVTSVTT